MLVNIFLHIPNEYKTKINYVFENLFFPYNISINVETTFSIIPKADIMVLYIFDEYEFPKTLKTISNLIVIVLKANTINFFQRFEMYDPGKVTYIDNVPCLFPDESSNGLELGFDLFSASFFFLSCWQEYAIKKIDSKGRIPLEQTLQFKLNFIRKPIVNEYLRIFDQYVYKLTGKKLEYKSVLGKKTAILISHDIDHIDWTLKDYMIRFRRFFPRQSKNYNDLLGIVYNIKNKKKIFELLKQIEEENDCEVTNYFLSSYPAKFKDELKTLKELLNENNHEIGHHISDKSIFEKKLHSDLDEFDANKLNFYGERVHTLRFQINQLFKQLDEERYLYDSSLLFAEDLGYRTGFSYPHYIFDPIDDKPFKTLSIAPNIMDTTVFEKKYLGFNDEMGFNEIKKFIKKNMCQSGFISILFHHSFFWFNSDSRLNFYKKLLFLIKGNSIAFITHKALYEWHLENRIIISYDKGKYEN